jgi:hypothetical protein
VIARCTVYPMTSPSFGAGLVVVALTAGCYGFYPHNLKRSVPPRADETAQITLEAKPFTSWTSCGPSDRNCEWHDGKLMDPYRYLRYYPSYGGTPITLGQLRALLDGDKYDAAWDKIERKKGMCRVSIAPTVIYFAAAIGSVVAFTLSKSEPDSTMRTYAYIGAGVAGGAALLSYPLGGYACMQAKGIAEDIEAQYGDSPYETANPGNAAEEREIDELQRRIDAFNRGERPNRKGAGTPTEPKPPEETPPDAPSAPDDFTPGTASLMKTLADAGELSQFAAILVETGIDRELAKGGPYTVAALNDAALSKFKDKLARLDKAERLQTFRDLIFVGVVTSGERVLKTLSGKTLTVERRKNGDLKVRGKSGSMRLVGTATNGVVYVVE